MQPRRSFSTNDKIRILAIGYILLCQQQASSFPLMLHVGIRLNTPIAKCPNNSAWPTKHTCARKTRCRHFSSNPTAISESGSPEGNGNQRPLWAKNWMPTWLFNLQPPVQIVALILAYIFHITVLCQRSIHFPVQLIPNERGYFQSIGLDSVAGISTLVIYQYLRRLNKRTESKELDSAASGVRAATGVPSLLSSPTLEESPWKNVFKSKFAPLTSLLAFISLVRGYFWTGLFSIFWEDAFYYLANFYPMTVAMHRSLCVLFGHLSWIVLGFVILRIIPRPQNLFKDQWYKQKLRGGTQWLWWTLGGYFVSSWLFNIADFVNQCVLPLPILEQAQNSVVSQLINPEFKDWLASAVGYIAPCITAPWWEEVLYRGFLLPAFLAMKMNYKWAVFFNGIVFSAHHMSVTGAVPLAVLAWVWCIVYAKSGNLLTTILIHAMWNSRIFIGSWFGL